ncbi:MAG: phytanoyl-CoA dioxygenase family protein [bacterium]
MSTPRREDPVHAANREIRFHPADPHAANTLSQAQIQAYNQNGFISPIQIFDAAKAGEIRAYIDALLESVMAADDQRNNYSINAYHQVCAGLWDLVTDPFIIRLIRDILGEQIVCWGSHLFAKLPNDKKVVPFHQDAVYWPLTPTKTVTLWLAIDDADADNAAMQFVPGSHLNGAIEHAKKGLDGTRVLGTEVVGLEAYPARYLNALKAGEASLHSDLLLHGSDANTSARRRAGLTMRYAAADVRLIDGYDHWRKSGVHVAAGDPENFWYNRPRPDGEYPQRMAKFWGEFDGQPMTS